MEAIEQIFAAVTCKGINGATATVSPSLPSPRAGTGCGMPFAH
jgi:hypothetical protein